MMAWILVSLLASFSGDAAVAPSPEDKTNTEATIGGDPFPIPR